MELLYFIVGMIFVTMVYTLWKSIKLDKENVKLGVELVDITSYMNKHNKQITSEVKEVEDKVFDILLKLEKDEYRDLSGINKEIGEVSVMVNKMNERFGSANKTTEQALTRVFSDMQQLKGNIKALGEDIQFNR
tara:strand:- start:1317 stop:1718 length:402 start_codon:yes stop_codon:yes gene_type:complete